MRSSGRLAYSPPGDQTVSVLGFFFLAMTLNPEAQKRAQDEIDAVLGQERRLPDFSDEATLPYVGALVKEVLRCAATAGSRCFTYKRDLCRWRPSGPLGVYHGQRGEISCLSLIRQHGVRSAAASFNTGRHLRGLLSTWRLDGIRKHMVLSSQAYCLSV